MKRVLFFLTISIVFYSCSKNKDTYNDDTKMYFPLQIGKQVVYELDSILWNDFTCTVDTHRYEVRWTINDTFRDNASRLCYTIDAEIRDSASADWRMQRVTYVMANATRLEHQEENYRFIKLIFPVEDNRSWDGNVEIATNSSENQYLQLWNHTYSHTGKPFNNGIQQFENTVEINAIDKEENDPLTDPYAYKIYFKEVYGKNIGLVYREMIYWVFDENVSRCRKGFGVIMRAKEHN